jgi:hypothetical protein
MVGGKLKCCNALNANRPRQPFTKCNLQMAKYIILRRLSFFVFLKFYTNDPRMAKQCYTDSHKILWDLLPCT